ncbi:glycoside hydrolase 3 [Hypoxylon texense]
MRFTTIVLAGLALAGDALGAHRQRQNNPTRGNASGLTDEEDILGDFHTLPYTEDLPGVLSEAMSLAKTDPRHGPNDKVPWQELPQCYQDCISANCCNGWPGLGDVRNLTVHQWCHSKWIPVQNWMHDHLQWCIKDACRPCRPKCRDDSTKWEKQTCAKGSS